MLPRILVAGLLFLFEPAATFADDILPKGEGRDVVEYVCSQCHGLLQVTQARKTAEQWQYLVTQMLNQGAPIEEYEVETVVRYLAEHFGE